MMKIKYLTGIIMICLLVFVSGCSKGNDISGSAVEDDMQESDPVSDEPADVVIIENTKTNENLVEELMKDLVDQDKVEEDAPGEEIVNTAQEIIIENFRGTPADVTIEKGTTVKWTNMMYFNHVIILLPYNGDGTYSKIGLDDLEKLWFDDSYEYTFDEVGKYKWGSKTKFEITTGIITVV